MKIPPDIDLVPLLLSTHSSTRFHSSKSTPSPYGWMCRNAMCLFKKTNQREKKTKKGDREKVKDREKSNNSEQSEKKMREDKVKKKTEEGETKNLRRNL